MLGIDLSIPSVAAAARPFSPLSLFASGEQGVWYDPGDLSTLFQDSAGTTPVTAVDQPVGLMRDKSGRGNHASQTSDTSRPLLQQDGSGRYYLLFDGSNDSLSTANINLSATNKMGLFAGIRKLSDSVVGIVAEFSANGGINNGIFILTAPNDAANANYGWYSKGTGLSQVLASPYAAPITHVITGIGDIASDSALLRLNGTQVSSNATDQGTGNYGNHPLFIGRRNNSSLPFNGRLYHFIVRGAASSSAQIAATEAWVNTKTGAY
jgi:hypothetical protein